MEVLLLIYLVSSSLVYSECLKWGILKYCRISRVLAIFYFYFQGAQSFNGILQWCLFARKCWLFMPLDLSSFSVLRCQFNVKTPENIFQIVYSRALVEQIFWPDKISDLFNNLPYQQQIIPFYGSDLFWHPKLFWTI